MSTNTILPLSLIWVACCSVTESCLTLCDPIDCSPPGSFVHRIFQVRILEWVAISSSRGSSQLKNQTQVCFISCIGRQILLPLCYQENPIWVAHQFSSISQYYPTLWDPMDCSTPGFPVCHQLLEPTQTHVHRVGDTIQPSHPLSSSSPPAFNLSQHYGLF